MKGMSKGFVAIMALLIIIGLFLVVRISATQNEAEQNEQESIEQIEESNRNIQNARP